MKFTKEEITGFTGSLLIGFLLILLLYLIVLRSEVKAGEEGVLVNFGTVDWSSGTFEPRAQGPDRIIPQEETTPPSQQIPTPETAPPVITQESEESVALEAAKREEEQRKRAQEEAERLRLAEEKRIAEEEKRKREAIDRQVSGAFGAGDSDLSQEGNTQSGTGNQGSSEGNAPTGVYEGVGGYGSFDLAGRSIGAGGLPKPDYSVQIEGRIVVNITVNPAGNVIFAEIAVGKGTNIDNAVMRRSALEAARKAKFNSINGTNNQSGTITYNYKLN
ncbi:TonB family protein [Bacteroidales bacterium OttesenSCG-928-A17]|nr:TonB family protein [Bacteroidales bacterium OttesenSCG-928-A17]